MRHRLKIINEAAYVTRNGFVNALVDVKTPRAFLYTRKAQVRATNVEELGAAMQLLPSYARRHLGPMAIYDAFEDRLERLSFTVDKAKVEVSIMDGDPMALCRQIPHGLCPHHDEPHEEYFLLHSKSSTWIAMRDLTPLKACLMRDYIKCGLIRAVKVPRNRVQLPLRPVLRAADGSNIIRRREFARNNAS
jgi:hypothetical protein